MDWPHARVPPPPPRMPGVSVGLGWRGGGVPREVLPGRRAEVAPQVLGGGVWERGQALPGPWEPGRGGVVV